MTETHKIAAFSATKPATTQVPGHISTDAGWRTNCHCTGTYEKAGDGIRTHDVQLGKLAFYH
jgi:hypothetical protein